MANQLVKDAASLMQFAGELRTKLATGKGYGNVEFKIYNIQIIQRRTLGEDATLNTVDVTELKYIPE